MLNNPRIESLGTLTERQFIVNSMPYKAVGCRVAVAAANGEDEHGRPIAKMGTPLTGDLTARQTAMTAAIPSSCVGVLVHDVPLYGSEPGNGSLLIDGGIILEDVDEDIRALIEATPLMNPESNIKVITRQ